MQETEFKPGDIVVGLEPDEHVEIRSIKQFGNKVLVEGVTTTSRREIRRPLAQDELSRLTKVRGSDYTYDGDAEAFLLGDAATPCQQHLCNHPHTPESP